MVTNIVAVSVNLCSIWKIWAIISPISDPIIVPGNKMKEEFVEEKKVQYFIDVTGKLLMFKFI